MNKYKKVFSVITSATTILYLSGMVALAPMAASAAIGGLNEGDIFKTASNPDVYIAKYIGSNAYKRLILNPDVFNSYGHLKWSNIKTVDQSVMDQFTTSDLVRALNDTKVYKLIPNGDVGTKQWLNMSAEAFTAAGYDWNSIYVINDTDRDNYTTGTEITSGTPTTSTVTPSGSVTVALASDTPAAGVAVKNALRLPVTKINLTAGAEAVTITALTVQRTGLADDASVSSLALIDVATNLQVGLNQSLNSSHQVVFREAISIPANTTKSYYLAVNMPSTTTSYAGQVLTLSLVAVETTGAVVGTLPITGNTFTVNATLTIGTLAGAEGSLNAATTTKAVGTTNYNLTGVKLTAGSAEDVTVYSIRFNQSGSAASSDLSNVVVSDGTTNYATTVSTDGKYYSASFGATGLVIGKGLSKEFTVKADIIGGSGRTIKFDIYRSSDIVAKGNVYGYYLSVDANTTWPFNTSGTPILTANTITVGSGTLRVDKNTTLAPAANVTKGATGVLLGAYDFVVTGEAVNVSSIALTIATTTGSSGLITNVVLAKSDGTILAGPINPNSAGDTATFTTTVSFPVGTTQVTVKGNLDTTWTNNSTIYVTLTPSTAITSITGATTGNAITASPTSAVAGNTMTVKTGTLAVSVSGTPVAQTIVKGVQGFTFANYLFDAGNSGEDIKITVVKIQDGAYTASTQADLTNLQLWDGATALNTGTNVVNPSNSATASTTQTITLDTPLVITKGTIKTLALKANVGGAATAAIHEFGMSSTATNVTATGVSTTQSITPVITAANGQKMTIVANGQYSVKLDSSTPTGKMIAANSTGNIMTVLRFKATSEQINVTKMTLGLTSASSTGVDVAQVYVYDGSTLLGQGTFPNRAGGSTATTGATTTITLASPLVLPADSEKVVTIKADIAEIRTTNTIATAGHKVVIDYVNYRTTPYNAGTGMASGASIAGFSTTGSDTAQSEAYIYKSVPTVSAIALTNKLSSGGALYRFRVAADAKGDIELNKFTFRMATTSATVTDLLLYNVSATPETQVNNDVTTVASASTDLDMILENSSNVITEVTIAAGTYKEFELRGTVTGISSASSVSTQLRGDSVFDYLADGAYMDDALAIDTNAATAGDNFIWSDMSASSHASTTADWANGYLVPGLPSSNLTIQAISG